jgi:hypothetical protein
MSKKHALALILFILIGSCASPKKEEKAELKSSDAKEQTIRMVHEIPSPSEIPFLLEATGVNFDPSLVNDHVKADIYARTNTKSAFNLGVYATDIGYFASYQKVQNVLNYLEASKKLADKLGVVNAFDLATLKRFESNLSSKDSLASIINQSINKADLYLTSSQRTKVAAFVLTGSFIEGLYISTALIKHYPKELLSEDKRNMILTPLIKVILDQEKPLTDLIDLLKSVEQDEDVTNMIASLEELKGEYRNLDLHEKIKNNRGDLVLTDGLLDALIGQTGKIRDQITHGE